MDRVPDSLPPDLEALVNALIREKPEDFPVEALLFDRLGLIDILRRALFEMHERRRQVTGTPAEPEIVQRINHWQEVLAWVRSHGGPDLVLMNRARGVQ
jgi:hypothetical protein